MAENSIVGACFVAGDDCVHFQQDSNIPASMDAFKQSGAMTVCSSKNFNAVDVGKEGGEGEGSKQENTIINHDKVNGYEKEGLDVEEHGASRGDQL